MEQTDLAVLGSGPAGHFGAIQAAKLGKGVIVVEALHTLGGASATYGTIPSKALRESVMHLTGLNQQSYYGINYRVKQDITVQDLTARTQQIVRTETSVFEAQLRRNGVKVVRGRGSFVSPDQIVVESHDGMHLVKAKRILIATGSRPAHPPGLAFDGELVLDSNQVLTMTRLPKRLLVVGAGVIGVEYACMFATLGVHVTLINDREQFLEFVDRQVVEVLRYQMQSHNIDFRCGESVVNLEKRGNFVIAHTASNKELVGDCLLYSIGRQGNTDELNLEATGLTADKRGRITVNESFQTPVPHIYAAGDVIGFPALASTSREQGRRAASHAFGVAVESATTKMPYGIYTIPEISMVGDTEQELTEKKVPYEFGVSRYREIARGQIAGDTQGMLKLLFHRETLQLLGAHIIGEGATELIHIGQAVQAFGGTIEYFASAVFNYPTLAECYKVAALDGLNKVRLARAATARSDAGVEMRS